ncbi:MAG: NAD-dependent epimerase/dehydratase family protein, partial [Candidatus Omnitrophica bacterium]|nr:NAD-dependent epimerase/dehydratase family protein [Candidatus Omnitrophota bacterium]
MESKGKVLITGAAGFVGTHLVKLLKDRGYSVVAMVRENTDTAYLKSLDVDIKKADLRIKESLVPAFEGVDAVVHLATTMKGPWTEYEESTINGTRRLLEVAEEQGIKKFVFISSIAVYDVMLSNSNEITEDSPLNTRDASNYERSKIEAENVVKEFAEKGVNCSILRSGVIYGPKGPVFPPRLGFGAGSNRYLAIGDGKNRIPFIYIHHLTEAIRLALESDQSNREIFNVVDDQDIFQDDYLNAYRQQVNSGFRTFHIPFKVMKVFGKVVAFLLDLLKRPTPIREAYLHLCAHQVNYPNTKLKEKLGWNPSTKPQEALQATMADIKERGSRHRALDLRKARLPLSLQRPMNVALVGCGVIAKTHLDILKKIGNVHIVALCDTNIEAARDLAKQYGSASAYDSVDEMLDKQKIDAVHILTPPQGRKEIVQKVAEKGCHILLEKPMALNADDAREMIAIADKNKVQICLGHNHLFDPPMLKARQLIARGAVGKIVHAESWYGFNLGANLSSRYMTPGAEQHWSMHLP